MLVPISLTSPHDSLEHEQNSHPAVCTQSLLVPYLHEARAKCGVIGLAANNIYSLSLPLQSKSHNSSSRKNFSKRRKKFSIQSTYDQAFQNTFV